MGSCLKMIKRNPKAKHYHPHAPGELAQPGDGRDGAGVGIGTPSGKKGFGSNLFLAQ